MKKLFWVASLICFHNIATAQLYDRKISPITILREYDGKYPSAVKLIGNSALTKRLKKLVGADFRDLGECVVESPIEVKGDLFIAFACYPHECPDKNYKIVYDFKNDILAVKFTNYLNGQSRVIYYSEDGSLRKELNE